MRKTRYFGRWQSLSVARAGRRMAGRPSPIMSGAMATWRRSSRLASRKADTVTPPPSTKIRRPPRCAQRAEQLDHLFAGGSGVEAQNRRGADVRFARADEGSCARVHGRRVGIVEDSVFAAEPPAGVEDHPQRVGAGHVARGQLRIVGRDRAGADDHDVAERAHAVQVKDVLGAGDELRLARRHRDETVEALAEVADRHGLRRRRAADRQVQVEQSAGRIVRREARVPAAAGLPCDHGVGMPDRHAAQLPDGIVPGKGGGFAGVGQPIGVVGCREREAPRAIRAPFAGGACGWLHALMTNYSGPTSNGPQG